MIAASSSAYTCEPIGKGDGPRLHAINRRCPISADFVFYFEREPDFFAWPDGAFARHRYIGIFRQRELVGYGMIGINRGWIGGELGEHLYLGDWRILPDHRGARLAQQGFEALVTELSGELTCGYCLVKRGNTPAERILRTHTMASWAARPLCSFTAANLLFLFRPLAPRRHRVRRATTKDAELLADLMRRAWAGRLFAPQPDAKAICQELEQLARAGSGAYYLAERGRRPVGLLRAWDDGATRRTVVLAYTARGKLIRVGVGAASRLLRGLAPLPHPGQAFRALTLHQVAVPDDDPGVLRDLLLAVVREHHGRGYHLAHLGLCAGDPLTSALRGLPIQRFTSELHLLNRRGCAPPQPERPVPWVDLQRI